MSGNNTPSGRTQAMARRKTKVSGNAKPAVPTRAQRKSAAPAQVEVAAVSAPRREVVEPSSRRPVQSQQPISVAEGREAAKTRRKQTMSGKAAKSQPNQSANTRVRKKPEPIIEPRAMTEPKAPAKRAEVAGKVNAVKNTTLVADNSGRKMSKAWRKALVKGKTGETAYKSKTGHAGTVAKMTNPDASTREIARSVRKERCTKGKSCGTKVETSKKRQGAKARSNNNAPEKVGFSETLSGQSVSGTKVGQGQLTGAESGACKLVSGSEYLGTEEFNSCSETPKAAPAKVTTTQTTKGQTISGNKMGQAQSVTGDRAGQCSGVTGTDYLPADQSDIVCAANSTAAVAQNGGFSISPGPSSTVNSSGTMTLDASERQVSGGNNYPAMSGSIQPSSGETNSAPTKVVMSTTFAGNATTGTQVGRPQDVTGGDSGYCKHVTGTGYQGKEEVETICQTSAPTDMPTKVEVSGTFAGQYVTGDRSGGNGNITGGEAGRCKSVSGTPYVGKESFENNCSIEQQAAQKKTQTNARQFGHSLTGVQPGPQGLTGAQKGACELVSGTHYQGADQASVLCQTSQAAAPGESDFPMMMGQAVPVNMSQPVASVEPAPKSSSITGDGWDRGSKVTGIDGPFATQRNPSIQGMQGQTPMGAANFRPQAMEEVPQSPITGSAGNTEQGAKVTLSGGARA